MPGPFHQALSDIALGLGVAVEIFALALVPLVMLRRKEPSSTFAWILTLVFLPGLGAALFLLHGRDRVRWPARRKRAADAVLETRLQHVRRETRVDPSAALEHMDESEQRIFRVCRALGPLVEVSDGNKLELTGKGHAFEQKLTEQQRIRIARAYRTAGAEAVEGFRTVLINIIDEADRARFERPEAPGKPMPPKAPLSKSAARR